jgi:hypothetical protein
LVHGDSRQAALIFDFPVIGSVALRRVGFQQTVRRRIARSLRPDSSGREKVEDFVPRDREQPAAERSLPAVVFPTADRVRHGTEHVLHQVGGVGVLQPALAGETIDHRAIERDEFVPRRGIGPVAKLHQQAGPRER